MKLASQAQTLELLQIIKNPQERVTLAKSFKADIKACRDADLNIIKSLMFTGMSIWHMGPAQYVADNQ